MSTITRLCCACGAPYPVVRRGPARRNAADHRIHCSPCRARLVPWLRYGLATRAVEAAAYAERTVRAARCATACTKGVLAGAK